MAELTASSANNQEEEEEDPVPQEAPHIEVEMEEEIIHEEEQEEQEEEEEEQEEEEIQDKGGTSLMSTSCNEGESEGTSVGSGGSGGGSGQSLQQQHVILSPQKSQDVRVDNWGNYCLQRLQVMYDRGDFCDLTIQFHTNQLLKVHRVIVNLCTDYFANLERLFGLADGILILPKDVDYQAMLTIVKFFYTGKLEIRGNQFNEVYKTVKLMNITILVKLLEAHAKKPALPVKKESTRPIVFKQSIDIGRPIAKGQLSPGRGVHLGGTSVKIGGTTALAYQGAGGTKTLQVTSPGVKLPPGVKTKTVLARVQPQGMRHGQSLARSISPKKLPIWKERKFTPGDAMMCDKWPIKDEPARPTRFEWGDPEEDPFSMVSSNPVVSQALMEKHKSKPASSVLRKAEDIFDVVKTQTLGKRPAGDITKSPGTPEEPPTKVSKIMTTPTSTTEIIMTPVAKQIGSNDVNLTEDTIEEEVSTSEDNSPPVRFKKTLTVLKPALKATPTRFTPMVGKHDPNLGNVKREEASNTAGSSGSSGQATTPVKSVRFAPEIEKENGKASDSHVAVVHTNEDVTTSHSKIIAEVLKKYPDLVKDKQNIKLKIVQKGAEGSSGKDKAKVSYIVLKSTSSPEAVGSVLLKKSNHTGGGKGFWDGSDKEKRATGAENTTGPWTCGPPCGGGDGTPIEFDSYYNYRRHLVEVHGERIDARICEYCGQKASKRNLLLYHLYTKHGVPPPKNMHFPNCDRCDYVALSESLLNKHKLTHDTTKEFSCQICNASFKSGAALQGHMAANLHRNKDTKVYECPYCHKPFVRNINLKGHIRALHRDIARIEEMDDPRLPHDEMLIGRANVTIGTANRKRPSILATRSVPLEIHSGDGTLVTADGQTIEILHTLDPHTTVSVPVTLVPSSEAEAMTSVANSIAASLGLDQGVHGTAEFITGVPSDGSQVYIMDGSQQAVVDMSSMSLAADGTMIYEGSDPNAQGQFIVQDIHGNQFRKMTGIDETGKQVIFFQLSEGHHGQVAMTPAVLEDGIQTVQENSSVYVSPAITEAGGTVVTQNSNQTSQVILTSSGHEGIVYDLVSNAHHQDSHHEHVEGQQQVFHQDEAQQLHIVLDENEHEGRNEEEEEEPEPESEGALTVADERQDEQDKKPDIHEADTQVVTEQSHSPGPEDEGTEHALKVAVEEVVDEQDEH